MLEATPVGGEETKTRPKTRIHTGTMNVRPFWDIAPTPALDSEAEPRLIVVISLNICCEPPTTVSLVFENPRCLGLHTQADLSIHAEAVFALWDLQVRERNLAAAIAIAQGLARDFPDNRELAKFLERHDPFQP